MDLLGEQLLIQVSRVLEFGVIKYGAHNWRKGFKWSRIIAALLRHTVAYMCGQTHDPETGLSHMAHAGFCVMVLLDMEVSHPDLDDRYKNDVPR